MSDPVTIAIVVSIAPTLTAFIGCIFSIINRTKITELHKQTNSRMDELLSEARKASYAEGLADGRTLEKNENPNNNPPTIGG